jgi:Ca2+-binding EF-hand superfamily protein
LKDCYDFFDTEGHGWILRDNVKSIMGNFGWANSNSKEIEEILINRFDKKLGKRKEQFSFDEVLEHVSRRFVSEGGKEAEFSEMFSIFDKKGKGEIGLADFRAVFEQFVDIYITDDDINSCIERIAGEGQKTISAGLLAEK